MATAAELAILISARDQASASLDRVRGKVSGLGSVAGTAAKGIAVVGTAIAAVGAVAFSFAKAAANEQVGIVKLEQAIKNLGGAYQERIAGAEQAIRASERLAFSDDESRNALALLVAQTGNYEDAVGRMAVAQNLARGTGMDLETASRLVGKITEENTQVLKRYGITLRAGATETEALAEIQKRFGGQAAAFADTGAGAWARFTNQIGNVRESLGAGLLPIFTKVFGSLANFLADNQEALVRFSERAAVGMERFGRLLLGGLTGVRNFVRGSQPLVAMATRLRSVFQGILPGLRELTSESGALNIFATQLALALGVPRGSEELLTFTGTLRAALDKLLNIGRLLGAAFSAVIREQVTALTPALREVREEAAALTARFAPMVAGIGEAGGAFTRNAPAIWTVGRAVTYLLEAWLAFLAVQKVVTLTQNVVRTGAAFISGVRNIVHTITQTIKRVGEFIVAVAHVAQTITQTIVHAGAKLIGLLGNFTQVITQHVVRTGAKLITLAATQTQTITQNVKIGTGVSAQEAGKNAARQFAISFAAALTAGGSVVLISKASGLTLLAFVKGLGSALALATGGISLAAAATILVFVTALVVAILRPDVAGKVAAALVAMFAFAVTKLPTLIQRITERLGKAFVEAIARSFREALPAVGEIIAGIITLDWGRAARGALDFLTAIFVTFPIALKEEFGQAFGEIGEFFGGLPSIVDWGAIGEGFQEAVSPIVDFDWGAVGEKFQQGLGKIAEFAANWGREFAAGFADVFFEMSGTTEEQWRDIGSKIKGAAEAAAGFAMAAFRFLTQTVPAFVAEMTAKAIAKFGELVSWVGGLPSRLLSAIGNLLGLLTQKGREVIDGLWSGMKAVWETAVVWLGDRASAIGRKFLNLGGLLFRAGKDVIQGFWDGMKRVWDDVTGWLGDRAGQILDLKGPPARDASMLVNAGQLVMGGFLAGLQRGWSPVQGFLAALGPQVERAAGNLTLPAPTFGMPAFAGMPNFATPRIPDTGGRVAESGLAVVQRGERWLSAGSPAASAAPVNVTINIGTLGPGVRRQDVREIYDWFQDEARERGHRRIG